MSQYPTADALPVQTAPTRRHTEGLVGGILLCLLGAIDLVHATHAFRQPDLLADRYYVGNPDAWGWALLAWGVLQIATGASVLSRSGGLTFGIFLAAVGAAGWLVLLPTSVAAAFAGVGISVAIIASLAGARR